MQRQASIFAPKSRQALLAAVLILLGYIGIISHAIGMDYAHADDCRICLQIKAQGHGLTSAPIVPQLAVFSEPPVARKISAILAEFYPTHRSRAPPAHSLA